MHFSSSAEVGSSEFLNVVASGASIWFGVRFRIFTLSQLHEIK